jgi:hypothetical protein
VSTNNKLAKTTQFAGTSRRRASRAGAIRPTIALMHRSATWAYLVIAVLAMASLALLVLASQASPA